MNKLNAGFYGKKKSLTAVVPTAKGKGGRRKKNNDTKEKAKQFWENNGGDAK